MDNMFNMKIKDFKVFYEWYHRDRKLPKRIVGKKNFTYRNIIEVLDKYCKANEILDVGSGVGTLDFYLANKGKKVTGIEISDKAYKVAKESLEKFKLQKKIKFIREDFLKVTINKKFPFVICSEVLEHLPKEKETLQKIHKLTNKGGLFMLTVPSSNAPLDKLGSIKAFDKRSGHLRRYTDKTLNKLMKYHGFKVIYSKKSEGIVRNSLYVYRLNNVIRLANKFPLISDIITFFDNITLPIFGESQLIIMSKKI